MFFLLKKMSVFVNGIFDDVIYDVIYDVIST